MLIGFSFLIPVAIFVFACSAVDLISYIMLYIMICCGKIRNLVDILKSEMQTRLLLDGQPVNSCSGGKCCHPFYLKSVS